jgi:hypothetical protein
MWVKIRVDVCINGDKVEIDSSFLERRESWLSGTGVYLEFILKGGYSEPYDFDVIPGGDGATVSRHAWNRFFLNLKSTDMVRFVIKASGKVVSEKSLTFTVVPMSVPLLFSVPELVKYSISDIRYFANRISENMVGGTRFTLFSSRTLAYLSKVDMNPEDSFWKMHELILSILTERGLSVYVSPFDDRTLYTIEILKQLRPVLLSYAERNLKFNLVWDLSGGIYKSGVSGVVDSFFNKFGRDIRVATCSEFASKLGGEGFAQVVVKGKMTDQIEPNTMGTKIFRIHLITSDFYKLRSFVANLVKNGWGVECVMEDTPSYIRKIQFSLGNALYRGYTDAIRDRKED